MAKHERIDAGRAGGAAFEIRMQIAAAHADSFDPHNDLVGRRRRRRNFGDADVANVVENRCAHVQALIPKCVFRRRHRHQYYTYVFS